MPVLDSPGRQVALGFVGVISIALAFVGRQPGVTKIDGSGNPQPSNAATSLPNTISSVPDTPTPSPTPTLSPTPPPKPSPTSVPPSASKSSTFEVIYQNKRLEIPSGFSAELDTPLVQPDSNSEQGDEFSHYPGRVVVFLPHAKADANASPQACVESIQTSPLSPIVTTSSATTFCIQHSPAAADRQGVPPKVFRVTIVKETESRILTILVSAWKAP